MNAAEGSIPTGRSSDSRTSTRLRDTLTVMEIALAASLLVCAGLTLRSLHALVNVDLGFATENRFAFKTNLTERSYPDAARADRFYDQLTSRLESLPGTVSIGAISYLPLSGEGHSVSAAPAESAVARDGREVTAGWGIVRGRYFETMGIALLRGRLFSSDDRPSSQPVAIVDDVLARRLWTNEAAAVGQPGTAWGPARMAEMRTVIGVVRRVSHIGPGQASLPMAYAPQSQVYQRGMYTVIRTTSLPGIVAPAVRSALAVGRPVDTDVLRRNGGRALRRGDRAATIHGRPGERVLDARPRARRRRDLRRDRLRRRAAHARVRHPARAWRTADAMSPPWSSVVSACSPASGSLSGRLSASALGSLMSGILFGVEPRPADDGRW